MGKLTTPILLKIEAEGQEPRIEEFNNNIIKIGKLSSVTLRLDDPKINRIHAVIEVTSPEEAQIIDMGSSKGTLVNDKKVHKSKLVSNDKILLGSTLLTIQIGEEAVNAFKNGGAAAPAADAGGSALDAMGGSLDILGGLGGDGLDGLGGESTTISKNPLLDDLMGSSSPDSTLATTETPQPAADVAADLASALGEGQDEATRVGVSAEEAAPAPAAEQPAPAVEAAPAPAPEQPAPDATISTPKEEVAAQPQVQDPSFLEQNDATRVGVRPDFAPGDPAAQAAPAEAVQQPVQAQPVQAQPEQPVQAQPVQAQPDMMQQQQAAQMQQQAMMQQQQQPMMQQQQPMMNMAAQSMMGQQQPNNFQSGFPQSAAPVQQQPMQYQGQQMTGGFAGMQQPAGFGAQQGGFQGGFQQQQPAGFGAQPGFASTAPAPGFQQMQQPVVHPPDPSDTDEVLEVRVLWGTTVLDHAHFYDPKKITIGESRKNTFAISSDALPADLDSFPLIETEGGRILINFTQAMGGSIQIKDQTFDLEQIKQSAKVQRTGSGFQFALPTQSKVHLTAGDVSFMISFVPAPKRMAPALLSHMDYHLARSMGASFLIHGLMFLFMLFYDEPPADLDDPNAFKNQDRFTSLIVHPPEPEKKPKKKKADGAGAKAKGKESKMGKKNKKVVKDRRAGQIKKNKDATAPIDLKKAEEDVMKELSKDSLLSMLGKNTGNTSKLMSAVGAGGDDKNAMGGLIGSKTGDSGGGGGLGLKGVGGSGGGGTGGTIGLADFGNGYKRGRGRKWGGGKLRRKKKPVLRLRTGKPKVFGSLDKEIIRRVIHSRRSQFKYCYEKELSKYPNLNGKIEVFFIISGNGRVLSSKIQKTSMNNDNVEGCVKNRVRYLRFPAPKGGGEVHVTYPFFFKPS